MNIVGMMLGRLMWFFAGFTVGLVLAMAPAPSAEGFPMMCDHRGFDHIQRHGGKEEDDRWHRMHGEQVTCDSDKDDGHHHADDKPEERHDDLPVLHHTEHHDDGRIPHLPDHHVGDRDHKWWR